MIEAQIQSIEFALPKRKEKLNNLLKDNPSWDIKKIINTTIPKQVYPCAF